MDSLDIEQAALRLGLSTKTLRRYVHTNKINYRVVRGKYLFSIEDLEQVRDRNIPATDNAALLDRIEALESNYSAISDRLRAIETILKEKPATLRPETPAYHTPPTLRPTRLVHNDKGLPDGLVGCSQFAALHNIAPTTAQRAVESGRLDIVRGEWHVGRAIVQRALDAAGRQRFYELFVRNPGFKPCDRCPHSV